MHKVEITLIFTTSYFRLDIFNYRIPIVIIIFTAIRCLKSCIVYPHSLVHTLLYFSRGCISTVCLVIKFIFFLQFLTAIQIFWFYERFSLLFFVTSFFPLTFQNLLHFYLPRILVPDLFLRLQTFYFIFSPWYLQKSVPFWFSLASTHFYVLLLFQIPESKMSQQLGEWNGLFIIKKL